MGLLKLSIISSNISKPCKLCSNSNRGSGLFWPTLVTESRCGVTFETCPICSSTDKIFEFLLKDYPLGNIYVEERNQGRQFLKNLTIFQCTCGHLSADSDFSAESIYNSNYSYLGNSAIPSLRRQHGLELILENTRDAQFNNLVDIGCGNFELLKLFMDKINISGNAFGIDPVLRENNDNRVVFINNYFENSDLDLNSGFGKPNLICLDNVMEHLENLTDFFIKFTKFIKSGDFIYVCVPSYEIMIADNTFEEISHEHLQYFSLNSLNNLFLKYDFSVVAAYSKYIGTRGYNFHLFQFRNQNHDINPIDSFVYSEVSQENISKGNFEKSFLAFRSNLMQFGSQLSGVFWGVCASEITPAISYFMNTDLKQIKGIFDTTYAKTSKYMPGLFPEILPWSELNLVSRDSKIYVTVPQLEPLVTPNLHKLGFRNIFFPSKRV